MTAVKHVVAHIAGTVWQVEAKVGDRVQAGDAVVVLESMKMEMPVEAPVAGVVVRLCCAPGEVVSEGQVLAEVDPA